MIAILLVAGYATRLYPLTINTPKPLLPVAGRAMLDYITDEIETLPDVTRICLVTNHRFAADFEKWAQDRKDAGTSIPIIVLDDGTTSNENRLGAIGDIQFVMDKLSLDEDIVVVAGDNLFTYRMRDMYDFFRATGKDTLVAIQVPDVNQLRGLAVATLDINGKVLKMVEKPQEPESDTAIYATYFYRRETLPLIRQYLKEGGTPDAPGHFPAWLFLRQDVYAYRANGTCIDIGTPENYRDVCENFSDLWSSRKEFSGDLLSE
jgi:glucose-1-phosphate thymidylyltransferase